MLATFTDGNPNAQPVFFSPAVNWGGTLIGTPTVSVQQVSQGPAGSTWEVIGNAAYGKTGTYTPTVTVNDAIGNTIQTSNTSINVTPGAVSLATSLVSLSSASVASGNGVTVTLQTKDANGNNLTTGGLAVVFVLGAAGGGQGSVQCGHPDNHQTALQYTGDFHRDDRRREYGDGRDRR